MNESRIRRCPYCPKWFLKGDQRAHDKTCVGQKETPDV